MTLTLTLQMFIWFIMCRGVATVDMDMTKLDINQCAGEEEEPLACNKVFYNSHKCPPVTKVTVYTIVLTNWNDRLER